MAHGPANTCSPENNSEGPVSNDQSAKVKVERWPSGLWSSFIEDSN